MYKSIKSNNYKDLCIRHTFVKRGKNKTTITLVLMISACVLSSLVQTALNTGISPIKEEPFLEIRMYALTAVLFGIAVVKIK